MASILTNQSAVARAQTPESASTAQTSCSINRGEFLYYSNNPESVSSAACADNQKFLYRDSVKGSGMVYTWHKNIHSASMTSTLLIYNSNSFAIKVSVPNYGLINGPQSGASATDANAWKSYFSGQSTSITIAAGAYGNLFTRTVAANNVWGIVAKLNITNNSTGTSADATLFDLTYIDSSKSGNATSFAAISGTHKRGKGDGFFVNLNCTLSPTDANGKRVNYGADSASTFGGNECVILTDAGGTSAGGKLPGAFGEQMNVTMTVKNTATSSRQFRIYIGSSSGFSNPVCSLGGQTVVYDSTNSTGVNLYRDVIDVGTIGGSSSTVVNFFTVVCGGSNSPYSFGARTV